ncbi:ABC transporter ATP-binding protein [Ktedonobacter racemifer]|uniref:ABC transporter related protein n=1 Tax=Ktedonobacter racemifer DSM 44963 TaxID=485913 RepID=D6U1A8_KTERA|nr:ABC transporter ATP-binding protein [Ktedonobacter racemifer]EFH82598.1 ABC transporter related protein [Ktedonobacter racemifer DSM 44963]
MSQARNGQRPGGGPMGGGPMGAMGRPVEKPKDFRKTFNRLLGYFAPYKIRLSIILIAAIIGTVFNIVGPKIMGLATTKLFDGLIAKYQAFLRHQPAPGIDFTYIAQILLLLLGLYVISAIFTYIQQYIMATVAQRTVYRLRREIEEKLSRLPLKFFDGRTHGEILSRAVNDMDNISTTLQQSITQLITSAVTLVGVIVLMFSISWLLSLIVLVTLPLSLLVTVGIAKRSQTYFRNQQRALGHLNGHVEEMYSGHKIVKAFGYEDEALTQFAALNEELYEAGWKAQFMSGMIMPLMRSIGNLGYAFVAVIGGIMVTQRGITIGDVQAFIQYAQQFTMPITQLANFANVIQSTMASAERVFELLDESEEIPDAMPAAVIEERQGAVEFQHVRFGYKEDAILMEDMNIHVQPGQMIAIVGPTGAGKTTLVNLLMRFYEVNGGSILVDGVDITQLKRGDLRRTFGMVLQDTWLFNGTIRDNIAYGHEGATEEEIVRSAKAAYADHFIRTLPEGYSTILNEEASNISQGQKQLLTIARAFLADPEILILDEATSSVDTRTEIQIQRAMGELMKGRTSFVIAHRLSTIRDADLILVMNHGTIIEQGTHEELLTKKGFYADLHNSQFTSQAPISEAV